VHTSLVAPLPHQTTAVYEAMLPRQPLRFLLADDPGTGKTITVTKNEVLYSLNKPDDYILAIVEFLDEKTHRVHYARRSFQREPDFGVTSVNYNFGNIGSGGGVEVGEEKWEQGAGGWRALAQPDDPREMAQEGLTFHYVVMNLPSRFVPHQAAIFLKQRLNFLEVDYVVAGCHG